MLFFEFSINPAWANLRAPKTIPWMPSSAPSAPLGQVDLKVSSEALHFLCGPDQCSVSATYQIQASEQVRVELRFLLPVEKEVNAHVGSSAASLRIHSAEEQVTALAKRIDFGYAKEKPPLYQAIVKLDLNKGSNEVTFEYNQPLGAMEHGHGYISEGRMLSEFTYVLWPLREWQRSQEFKIDVSVTTDRPRRSLWKFLFGKKKEIGCLLEGQGQKPLKGVRQQQNQKYIYQAQIISEIPDTLHCYLGDEDLVEKMTNP